MQKILSFLALTLISGASLQASSSKTPTFQEGYMQRNIVFNKLFEQTRALPVVDYKNVELDPRESYRVFPVLAGETRIVKKSSSTFIFAPKVQFGHLLVAETDHFIGVGHFIETYEQKLPLFLTSLCDQEPIRFVTLAGSFGSAITEPMALMLASSKISYKHLDLPAIMFTGKLEDGFITENAPIAALSQYLGDGQPITTNYKLMEIVSKYPYPRQFAIDCSDGHFLNLSHTYDVFISEGRRGGILGNTSAFTVLQYAAMSYFLNKKSHGEMTDEELKKIVTQYNLMGN